MELLSQKYWLNNDSYAITNDALHKVNDSTIVKWNFNYVNELSKIENNLSSIFCPISSVLNKSRNQLKRNVSLELIKKLTSVISI
jgi:hypothetical protein